MTPFQLDDRKSFTGKTSLWWESPTVYCSDQHRRETTIIRPTAPNTEKSDSCKSFVHSQNIRYAQLSIEPFDVLQLPKHYTGTENVIKEYLNTLHPMYKRNLTSLLLSLSSFSYRMRIFAMQFKICQSYISNWHLESVDHANHLHNAIAKWCFLRYSSSITKQKITSLLPKIPVASVTHRYQAIRYCFKVRASNCIRIKPYDVMNDQYYNFRRGLAELYDLNQRKLWLCPGPCQMTVSANNRYPTNLTLTKTWTSYLVNAGICMYIIQGYMYIYIYIYI